MASISTSNTEEQLIRDILHCGLERVTETKLAVLRLGLAKSLNMTPPPDDYWDKLEDENSGKSYKMARIWGVDGRTEQNNSKNYKLSLQAMLSVLHNEDLIADHDTFVLYLKRHVHRGLSEIRRTWQQGDDFPAFLLQEFHPVFQTLAQSDQTKPNLAQDRISQLKDALASIGVNATITATQSGARLIRAEVELHDINQLDKLQRGIHKLNVQLGLNEGGLMFNQTDKPGKIALDIPKDASDWLPISGNELVTWAQQAQHNQFTAWLGQNILGENVTINLLDLPHLLVAGTTGSGKV